MPARTASWARRHVVLLALSSAALAALLAWFQRPAPAPKVLRTVRLTHFGRTETYSVLVSDGLQVYLEERTGGRYGVARVPVEGGEPAELATPFPNTVLMDISPDRSELLVLRRTGTADEGSLWALPTSGGSPRPVGNLVVDEAAWCPDGQRIVYVLGSDLYLAKVDGSGSRKIASVTGRPHRARWSPDGRVVRFTIEDLTTHYYSLWEISGEGRNLHRLLAGWRGKEAPTTWDDGESGAAWTPDGKYFIFESKRANVCSIWAIREKRSFLSWRPGAPMLITTTDSYLNDVTPARNGKRLFFAGSRYDFELDRYESRLRQFVPYLGGVPVHWGLGFSRDREWVAYTIEPGGVLWRSRVGGTERLQLTFPPMAAGSPRWSPDGKSIAFAAGESRTRVYSVASDGGSPKPLTPERYLANDPEWSPDGSSLLFSVRSPSVGSDRWSIYRLDFTTHEVNQVPGSEGLRAPAYSPDGKEMVAVGTDGRRLMLFDVQSERWVELARGTWFNVPPYWSRDGKYVYAQDLAGVDQPVVRVRVSNRKVEIVATRKQFARSDVKAYSLAGLMPDGSPLVSIILGHDDIYALDVDFP